MNLLALESATESAGAAVVTADGRLAWAGAAGRRRHTETLAPAVAHVLDQAGLSPADLDLLALDVGPGLFTGLRVGAATALGLGLALGLGVLEVTSTEILALAAYAAGAEGDVLSVVDARRGQVFCARYGPPPGPDAPPVELEAPAVLDPARLASAGPGSAVGDGARRHAGVLAGAGRRVVGPAAPPPEVLAELARRSLAGGATPVAPVAVRPRYLRPPDTRINWPVRPGVGGPG